MRSNLRRDSEKAVRIVLRVALDEGFDLLRGGHLDFRCTVLRVSYSIDGTPGSEIELFREPDAFVFLPVRLVLAGEARDFLRRAAQLQWGVLVCVYFISHVPALLMLGIPGYEGQNVKRLFFFATVVQLNDVFQYVWGKLFGRHKITPTVSPNKTWEGFIGGALTATAVGALLAFVTPFAAWQAALFALAVAVLGFTGDVTLSAVKRDAGVKDFSEVLPGHGGVLDRFDSTCFAAPVFFHLTRYFFVP